MDSRFPKNTNRPVRSRSSGEGARLFLDQDIGVGDAHALRVGSADHVEDLCGIRLPFEERLEARRVDVVPDIEDDEAAADRPAISPLLLLGDAEPESVVVGGATPENGTG